MLLNIKDNWDNAITEHQDFFKKEVIDENNRRNPSKNGEKVAKDLVKKHESNLACGNQVELKKIANEYLEIKEKLTPQELLDFENYIKNLISYRNFSTKSKGKWDAYALCKKSTAKTCPYCNLAFAHTIIRDNAKILRPTLDHFFSKDNYPILALSLYNLVPACAPCNSYLKGTLDFLKDNHPSPFWDEEPDFYIENMKDIIIRNAKSAIIKIDKKTKEQEKSNNTFALFDRYEIFSEEIAGIISEISTYKGQITKNIPREYHEILFEIMLEGVNKENYKNKVRGKLMLKLKDLLID